MSRRTVDVLVSTIGLLLAVVLGIAGGLLTYGHNYITDQVKKELSAQKIIFPAANSPAIAAPQYAAMKKYAGQTMTTGDQAQTYANHFIAEHLKTIGGGQTYSQLSSQSLKSPDDAKLAEQVQEMFRGETLRGLLLNAYAFGTMAKIMGIAAIVAFIGAAILLILAIIGYYHAFKTPKAEASTA